MGLQVIDLRSKPERIFLLEDRRSRCRWQVVAKAEPAHSISNDALHMLACALGSHLVDAPHDGTRVDLIVQKFGCPATEVVVQYRLQLGEQRVWVVITISAWIDAALDGDASTWQVVEAHKHDITRCMAALAYATLTES